MKRALLAGAKTEIGKKDKNWGVPRKPTYTPLYRAVIQADLRAAQLLIEAGADPNTGRIKDNWNVNPLGLAIKDRNKPMIKLLLDAGADLELLDADYRDRLVRLIPKAANKPPA